MNTKNTITKEKLPDIRRIVEENVEENKAKTEELKKKNEENNRLLESAKRYEIAYFDGNKQKLNINSMGDMIINELCLHFITLGGSNSGKYNILYYDDKKKHHVEGCIGKIPAIGQQIANTLGMGKYFRNNHGTELIGKIARETYKNPSDIEAPSYLINVRNGILNTEARELEPHNAKYVFKTSVDVDYKEGAKCPKFINFLGNLCSRRKSNGEEMRDSDGKLFRCK